MNRIAVIYHESCPDGFGAAWVAWKKFGSRADYFPVPPRIVPEKDLTLYSEIYILDNCFEATVIKKLVGSGARVIIIDHHISSKADVQTASVSLFDVNHSAAVLAWKYFFPKEKIPKFLKYVEAGDLWKSNLPNAEAVRAFIGFISFDFKEFSKIVRSFELKSGMTSVVAEGRAIMKFKNVLIHTISQNAYPVSFFGKKVFAVNSPVLISDVGQHLAALHPPFAIVWSQSCGRTRVSLRSVGSFDVSKLAAQIPGGGGHPNAAGFSLPEGQPFPWKNLNS